MDKGDGWQQLQPLGDAVSYFDPSSQQLVAGGFEGPACATAAKAERGAIGSRGTLFLAPRPAVKHYDE